jgi:hypothetical protein
MTRWLGRFLLSIGRMLIAVGLRLTGLHAFVVVRRPQHVTREQWARQCGRDDSNAEDPRITAPGPVGYQ